MKESVMSRIPMDLQKKIDVLILLSRNDEVENSDLDFSSTTQKQLMATRESWKHISNSLQEDDLFHLIKGFVIYEQGLKEHGYGLGGSVSPVIILCERYAALRPDHEKELMAWVVKNRTNPYLPFGSIVLNECTSFKERNDALIALEHEKRKKAAIEDALQAERALIKAEKEALNATTNLPNAVRRGDLEAVKALVEKGGDLTVRTDDGKSLFFIAKEHDCSEVTEYLSQMSF